MRDATDAELVSRVLGREIEAFSILVRRYQDAHFRFAVRMLGSRDDADDALQSAFVRAYRKLDRCREPARFGAWLFQIVINECRTLAARRDRRERRFSRDEGDLPELPMPGEIQGDGDADMQTIQRALDRLDPEQREAFILKHVEELSYDEMSRATGAGVSALKMRVLRARDRLRELLDLQGV